MSKGVLMKTKRGVYYLERPSDYKNGQWNAKSCFEYCREMGYEEHNANKLILLADKISDKKTSYDKWYDNPDNFENIEKDMVIWGAGLVKED